MPRQIHRAGDLSPSSSAPIQNFPGGTTTISGNIGPSEKHAPGKRTSSANWDAGTDCGITSFMPLTSLFRNSDATDQNHAK